MSADLLAPVDYAAGKHLAEEPAQQAERLEYALRNLDITERARQEEMKKRDAAETELAKVRHHLTQLATFADQAALVLATIEAESTEEEEKLQAIIDGLQRWAPDALREAITTSGNPA